MNNAANILVVEDDRDFRDNICDLLSSAGYKVEAIETVEEFQNSIKDVRFDIALIDVNLPDGSGHQIARFLRNSSYTRIVMITARGSEADRLESYASGADMHLLKPVSVRELHALIGTLLGRLSEFYASNELNQNQDFVLTVNGWTLRPVPAKLTSPGGMVVELSVRDYLLIELMMKFSKEIISYEFILNKTKFTEKLTTISHLNDRISMLNKKIESAVGRNSPIQLIQNEGFFFRG